MDAVELLTVEDSFQITERGVVVVPDFEVPNGWKNRTETVVVVRPDGQRHEVTGEFSMSHFKPLDPKAPIDKRWRIELMLRDYMKNELPIGSKILVSHQTREAILSRGLV
jgi:hypothetical protein